MKKQRNSAKKRKGNVPGQLVYTGEETGWATSYEYWSFNSESFKIEESDKWQLKSFEGVVWTNVFGLHNIDKIQEVIGDIKLDHLLGEDITNVQQRPKIVISNDLLFTSIKVPTIIEGGSDYISETISLVLKGQRLYCFQERKGDVFDSVRMRIELNNGRVRKMGANYLFFCLLDVLADHYHLMLDEISNSIDKLEDDIFNLPNESQLETMYDNKKLLLQLRKAVHPLRDAIGKLIRTEDNQFDKTVTVYLHDLQEQLFLLSENIESNRELNAGLKDLYMSSLSFKMNKVMQTLTILSVIFIPLTFIAGVYGMNLKSIPEMEWKYGYLYFWILTIVIGSLLAWVFKKRGWF